MQQTTLDEQCEKCTHYKGYMLNDYKDEIVCDYNFVCPFREEDSSDDEEN